MLENTTCDPTVPQTATTVDTEVATIVLPSRTRLRLKQPQITALYIRAIADSQLCNFLELLCERDLCALLTVALARLALLDTSAFGLAQLPPTDRCSWHQILIADNLDRCAHRADGSAPRMQVVKLLSCRWVGAQKDTDRPRVQRFQYDRQVWQGSG